MFLVVFSESIRDKYVCITFLEVKFPHLFLNVVEKVKTLQRWYYGEQSLEFPGGIINIGMGLPKTERFLPQVIWISFSLKA